MDRCGWNHRRLCEGHLKCNDCKRHPSNRLPTKDQTIKTLKAEVDRLKLEFLYCNLGAEKVRAVDVLDIQKRRERMQEAIVQPFVDRAEKAEAKNEKLLAALTPHFCTTVEYGGLCTVCEAIKEAGE